MSISQRAATGWEATFTSWSRGPSDTEATKCENAERMIRKAISASRTLANRAIEVFTQGSYRNNTNVRLESDVDICVRLMDLIDLDMPPTLLKAQVGLIDASGYCQGDFKNEVGVALRSFSARAVSRAETRRSMSTKTHIGSMPT